MCYFAKIDNGHIASYGTAGAEVQTPITETKFNAIRDAVQNKPTAPDGYTCMLNATTLEWELVELPPTPDEPTTDDEALTRYANELTGSADETLTEATETLIKQLKEANK